MSFLSIYTLKTKHKNGPPERADEAGQYRQMLGIERTKFRRFI